MQRILALPMNRRDIADYLGLTLETIARTMTSLRVQGLVAFIGLNQRQIVLRDRERLLAGLDL
jgi:CRP/FNR family nitrogen fixation transcriptional regulator